MQLACAHLKPLLDEAIHAGCALTEVSDGWSKVKRVLHMSSSLPTAMHNSSATARYYKQAGSPHNAPEEGFICDLCGVALSFPMES